MKRIVIERLAMMSWAAQFKSIVLRFQAEPRGNVAVIFSIAMLPIMSSVGAAVDFSHVNSVRTAMQAAVDSTAVMVANTGLSYSDTLQQQAAESFKALLTATEAKNPQISLSPGDGSGVPAVVTATADMKTDFMGIMGIPNVKITVRSAAVKEMGGQGCVLALNAHASGAISTQGG